MSAVMALGRLGPEEAAERIFRTYQDEGAWLDAFTESLDRQRAGRSFARTITLWALSQAEVARIFGVSRQAVGARAEAAGLRGVRARSAQSPDGAGRELAWFPPSARSVARRVRTLAFTAWFRG